MAYCIFSLFQVSLGKIISTNENGPEVIFFRDESGMFCLDTTPEVGKEKPRGPRFTRVCNTNK
jgi:hypothetical protein